MVVVVVIMVVLVLEELVTVVVVLVVVVLVVQNTFRKVDGDTLTDEPTSEQSSEGENEAVCIW